MALASTSAPDLLLLLQQLASQQQEIQRLQAENKHIQSLEEENKRLKLALAHHARMCQLSLKTDPSFASKIDPRCY